MSFMNEMAFRLSISLISDPAGPYAEEKVWDV